MCLTLTLHGDLVLGTWYTLDPLPTSPTLPYFYLQVPQANVDNLWDEIIGAAQRRYGNSVLFHLHSMKAATAARVVARHRSSAAIFADETHPFPATVLGGLLAAVPLTEKSLANHSFMIVGDSDLKVREKITSDGDTHRTSVG